MLFIFCLVHIYLSMFVLIVLTDIKLVTLIFPILIILYVFVFCYFFFSSRRRHTSCALVTGVQTCALPISPRVLYELGAEVVPIGVAPDGFNINDRAGAVAPQAMRARVVEERADVGLAFDGDADRLILADEIGQVIDGDQILGMIARSWSLDGRLKGGGVVATVMSNLGLERYLESLDLKLLRTKVGDSYVLERMRSDGYNIGGEQSGHMIFSDYAKNGDGLLAALQVLEELVRADAPL